MAVEGVGEVVRRVGVAAAREVGGDQPPAVGQPGQQIAELVGRAGVSVRQQHDRCVVRAGLAVKHLIAVQSEPTVPHHASSLVHPGKMRHGDVQSSVATRSHAHDLHC